MNKKLLPILIVVLLVLGLGGFGASKFFNKSSESPSSEESIPGTIPIEEQNSVNGNILDLMKLGKSVKCSYSISTDGNEMTGVSYVSAGMMRGDFSVKNSDGTTVDSHMISDSEWIYTWTSTMPQGFKMKVMDAEAQNEESATGNMSLSNLRENFDYECVNWVPDESLFIVPSNITFTDFSDMMDNFNMESAQPGDTNPCSTCDFLPNDSDKEICRDQLGC